VRRTFALERRERALELRRREKIGQAVEHGARDAVTRVELDQLREELILAVMIGRRAVAGDEGGRERVERQRALGVDGPRPELDRRDVPLTDGPQAHDESSSTLARARLIGRRNDGRIEESRALDRVLVGEVGADEQPPRPGHGRTVQPMGHQRVVPLEKLFESVVTVPERNQRSLEHRHHVGLGQGEDPRHQETGARHSVGGYLLARQVRLGDHAPRIGAQDMRRTPDHLPSYSNPSPARSSISINDNRKDTVLSAP
jgi:hypothetical protein